MIGEEMKKYRKYLTDRLWNDFQSLQSAPHIFDSFVDYYNALATWVKEHIDIIDEKLICQYGLKPLLGIDPAKYIVPANPIQLKIRGICYD